MSAQVAVLVGGPFDGQEQTVQGWPSSPVSLEYAHAHLNWETATFDTIHGVYRLRMREPVPGVPYLRLPFVRDDGKFEYVHAHTWTTTHHPPKVPR